MTTRSRPLLPLLLAVLLGSTAAPQEQPPAPPPTQPAAPPQEVPAPVPSPSPSPTPKPPSRRDLMLGAWTGSADFASADTQNPCHWVGAADLPAIKLDLARTEADIQGSLALQLPGAAGTPCGALRVTYEIHGVKLTASTVSFTDPAERTWNLGLKEGALKGLVAGKDMSGEVTLAKPAAAAAGPAAGPTPPPKGQVLSGVGGIIAANVIGLGALLGVNKLAADTKQSNTGKTFCSPRNCFFADPRDCTCNTPLLTGASCGNTTAGATFNQPCDASGNPPTLPCAEGFSCDNNVCDDVPGTRVPGACPVQ